MILPLQCLNHVTLHLLCPHVYRPELTLKTTRNLSAQGVLLSPSFQHLQEQSRSTPSLNTIGQGPSKAKLPRAPQLRPFDVEYQRKLAVQKLIEKEAIKTKELHQFQAYMKQAEYEKQRAALLQVHSD